MTRGIRRRDALHLTVNYKDAEMVRLSRHVVSHVYVRKGEGGDWEVIHVTVGSEQAD
jgi:hypothetical protein